jgi:ribosome-associated protein
MAIDITQEIRFRTARSGGKGGQNVNKVETMAEGIIDLASSSVLNDKQKDILRKKLSTRINRAGELHVRSQAGRSQLENKERVVTRMNDLINQALKPEKPRKPTKPTRAAREKRLLEKRMAAEKKEARKKNW